MRREDCACGGVLFSHGSSDDAIKATVEEHNARLLHSAWMMAGGFDSGLILLPMRKPLHRTDEEPEGLDAYEGNLRTGTMG